MSEAQPSSNPLADIFLRSGQAGQILELFKSNLGDITERAAAFVLPEFASSLVSQIADAALDRLKETPDAIIAKAIEARKPAFVTMAYAKPIAAEPVKPIPPPVVARAKPVQLPILREVPVAPRATPTAQPFRLVPDGNKPTLREARPIVERKRVTRSNGVEVRLHVPHGTALIPLPPTGRNTAIQPVVRRDPTELEQAIQQEIPRLRRYARSLTRDVNAADDLVQDTLQRGLSKISLFKEGTDIRAWLFTILHNQHVNNIRKAVRQGQSVDVEAADVVESLSTVTEGQMDKLKMRDLANGLSRLPEEQRQVILYIGLQGNSYEQAAEHFGIPVGTIRSRLSRGRELLRELMDGLNVRELPSDRTARIGLQQQFLLLTARS